MGGICNQLGNLPQLWIIGLVDGDGQDDRGKKPGNQSKEAQADGVVHQPPEHGGLKEVLKVLEADPGTSPDTKAGIVVFKGQLDAEHGDIIEYNDVNQGEQQHEVQLPSPQRQAALFPGR